MYHILDCKDWHNINKSSWNGLLSYIRRINLSQIH